MTKTLVPTSVTNRNVRSTIGEVRDMIGFGYLLCYSTIYMGTIGFAEILTFWAFPVMPILISLTIITLLVKKYRSHYKLTYTEYFFYFMIAVSFWSSILFGVFGVLDSSGFNKMHIGVSNNLAWLEYLMMIVGIFIFIMLGVVILLKKLRDSGYISEEREFKIFENVNVLGAAILFFIIILWRGSYSSLLVQMGGIWTLWFGTILTLSVYFLFIRNKPLFTWI